MENDELYLGLASVFSYLQANFESKCFVEGEALLNAKHIILIGKTVVNEISVEILALCLQTSAIKSAPHEIKGKLDINGNKLSVSQFTCSCKAGLSGICKHIAAVLLKCTRSNISSLEKLSTTDVKCYWSSRKREVGEEYEAKPILETSCSESKVTETKELTHDQQQECFQLLSSVCQESSLTLHLKGRATAQDFSMEVEEVTIPEAFNVIVSQAAQSLLLENLNLDIKNYSLKPCCTSLANDILDLTPFNKALMCAQKSTTWHEIRQLRITGSRCYSIYTYSKDDWNTKATNYFFPKKLHNRYVEHGLKYESEALNKYKLVNNYTVIEMGLIICRQYTWLAYSPDGIVMENGYPTRLVEIKCPYDGLDNDAINFVHTCSFLKVSADRGVALKKRHGYYGQVQLGMAILGLKMCDLILYSAISKTFLNIVVHFDEQFAAEMILNITAKYFTHMLHVICKKGKINLKVVNKTITYVIC